MFPSLPRKPLPMHAGPRAKQTNDYGTAMRQEETNFVAHVRPAENGKGFVVHALEDHLQEVGRICMEFAGQFGNGDWGYAAGVLHDLGKYKADFQSYIRDRSGLDRDEADEGGPGKVDHTAAGALYAVQRFGPLGRALAYLIAGHHSGLPDWHKANQSGRSLSQRLSEPHHLERTLEQCPPKRILEVCQPATRPCGALWSDEEHVHLWVRMLFSCLVDADFLDTELFMDSRRASSRPIAEGLPRLKERFDAHMEAKQRISAPTAVNLLRKKVLAQCIEGAAKPPGLFTLTVPTGGGKTLASIGFALEHALLHKKRRIIVVIPYTSIIEQTAEVLRSVFGKDNVLEHHSNLDPDLETSRSKLATENWDAPIVVTTNVQLFESLFASRTSACRKLHNVCNSILVLDEAQMLPPEFLKPILSVLRGLSSSFGVTAVLCTATQPALGGTIGTEKAAFLGLDDVTEIISSHHELAKQLKRVEVVTRGPLNAPSTWQEIASDLLQFDQVLCVVNTRANCRELHALLPQETIHLSALMCGEHRSEVISSIKAKLKAGEPIRVVSTQLVEAGVDLDFPVVYRALAGLDSIAQAAGRCNREGMLPNGSLGKVVVFAPPMPAPPGLLRKGEDATKEIFRCLPDIAKELSPQAFASYFKQFFSRVDSFDAKGITQLLQGPDARDFNLQFRTAASLFSLIDDAGQKPIVVWFKRRTSDSRVLLGNLSTIGPNRALMRKLQRYTVNVPERVWKALQEQGAIAELKGPDGPMEIWAQTLPGLYDDVFGLRVEGPLLNGDEFVS